MEIATATWADTDASSLGSVFLWSPEMWVSLVPFMMSCLQNKTPIEANRILLVPFLLLVPGSVHPRMVTDQVDQRRKVAMAIFQMRAFFAGAPGDVRLAGILSDREAATPVQWRTLELALALPVNANAPTRAILTMAIAILVLVAPEDLIADALTQVHGTAPDALAWNLVDQARGAVRFRIQASELTSGFGAPVAQQQAGEQQAPGILAIPVPAGFIPPPPVGVPPPIVPPQAQNVLPQSVPGGVCALCGERTRSILDNFGCGTCCSAIVTAAVLATGARIGDACFVRIGVTTLRK
jgi:hypothetical protein